MTGICSSNRKSSRQNNEFCRRALQPECSTGHAAVVRVGEIEPHINAVLKAKIYATGHAAVVRGGGQKTLCPQ